MARWRRMVQLSASPLRDGRTTSLWRSPKEQDRPSRRTPLIALRCSTRHPRQTPMAHPSGSQGDLNGFLLFQPQISRLVSGVNCGEKPRAHTRRRHSRVVVCKRPHRSWCPAGSSGASHTLPRGNKFCRQRPRRGAGPGQQCHVCLGPSFQFCRKPSGHANAATNLSRFC